MDNVSRASSSEISGIFNKNAVMSRETLLSLAVPKTQSAVLEDLSLYVHRNVAGNFALVEEKVIQNVDRINNTITAALELSPRRLVPEAFSNHIARLEMDPTHGGRIKRKLPAYKYKKVTLPVHREVQNPDWNGRFVFADSLEKKKQTRSSDSSVSKSAEGRVKAFMNEFRHKAARDALAPSKTTDGKMDEDEKHDPKRSREFLVATYLFQKLPKKKPSRLPKLNLVEEQKREQSKVSFDPQSLPPRELTKFRNVVGKYKYAWEGLVADFNERTSAMITYKLLVDLSNLVHPPTHILPIVGYICLLFGLEPTWAAAKKYLFHEVNTFHRFLCQVNPLLIAIPHLQMADKCYREEIEPKKEIEEKVYKPIVCLVQWIESFQYFAKAILGVYCWRCRTSGVSSDAKTMVTIADVTDETDLNCFYWNIKQIDSADSDFWSTFEKFLPLRYVKEIVDDEVGDVLEASDSFDYADLTTEAAFFDVVEAEKVIENVTEKPNKTVPASTFVNSRREILMRMPSKLKRNVSSRLLNNLSLGNIKTSAADLPAVAPVSGVSKRLYDIESISQSLDSSDSTSPKQWGVIRKNRLQLPNFRSGSEGIYRRGDSASSTMSSSSISELDIATIGNDSVDHLCVEGLAAQSTSLGSVKEHIESMK